MKELTRKIIRKVDNTLYILATEETRTILNKRIKETWWLECDKDGNISDGNKDGVLKNMKLHCKIPDNCDDLDISSLSEDCLK